MTDTEIDKLKKMYNDGYTQIDIANAIGYNEVTINRHIKALKDVGALQSRKRGRPKTSITELCRTTPAKKKKPRAAEPKTAKNGVRCTRKVSQTCQYGMGNTNGDNLCDYLLLTGHVRPCPWEDCTCYQRIGAKRRKAVVK